METYMNAHLPSKWAEVQDGQGWAYARVGIPGEGGVYTEADAKNYAQVEANADEEPGYFERGYGSNRRDMFLIDPAGQVWMPDRAETEGPITWVHADEKFLAYLAEAGWEPEDLEVDW